MHSILKSKDVVNIQKTKYLTTNKSSNQHNDRAVKTIHFNLKQK